MSFFFRLLNLVLNVFEILVIVYVAFSWLRVSENKWTILVRRVVEPVLLPFRKWLQSHLPSQLQIIDFSPLACLLAITLLRRILSILRYGLW